MAFHFLDGKDDLFHQPSYTNNLSTKDELEQLRKHLGLMEQNGDPRVTYDMGILYPSITYFDDTLCIVTSYNDGWIHIQGIINNKQCDLLLRNSLGEPQWVCSPECKANTIKYINDVIFDKTYESIQTQFCRKLANMVNNND